MQVTIGSVPGDELRARAVLAEMQARLAQGPHAALGIAATASTSEVRTAFLQLTKTYHPTRFARMSPDVQRLSNEVFLALRGAHDAIAKRAGRPNQSGNVAILPSATPPNPSRPTSGAIPLATRQPPPRAQSGPLPTTKLRADATGVQRANDSSGVRRIATPSPSPPDGSEPRSTARAPTPAAGVRIVPDRRSVPTSQSEKVEDRELAAVVEMMHRQQWDSARTALNVLANRSPASTKIRALQCYARGREAQFDRRLDEARVELDQALQLDPDLQLAKTALGELFTRRK